MGPSAAPPRPELLTNWLVSKLSAVSEPPRRRDAERTTADLLAAAQEEFAEYGFAGARVDRIAARAGCNKALIFARFGDKEGLYRAVFAALGQRWLPQTEQLGATLTADTRDGFAASIRALVGWTIDFLRDEPEIARIVLWEIASGWAHLGAGCPDEKRPTDERTDQIRAFLAAAHESGFLRSDLPSQTQLMLVTQIPMVLSAMRFDVFDPALRAFITDFIVTGLVVPDAPAKDSSC